MSNSPSHFPFTYATPVANVAGSGSSAVAGLSGKKTAEGTFSNLISPSISGFIFERNEPPQRQPLSLAQRRATFQPMSLPSPVSFANPSGAKNGGPLRLRFSDSSRMSARAKLAPTAADHVFANDQAKFALKLTTARFDSREI